MPYDLTNNVCEYFERIANENQTDMWSQLKKLNNPPSSRAALEIVRADSTISNDLKEVLERWLSDISKLFSGIRDDPDMAFDDKFYEEILVKKSEFENLSKDDQEKTCSFDFSNRPDVAKAGRALCTVRKARTHCR